MYSADYFKQTLYLMFMYSTFNRDFLDYFTAVHLIETVHKQYTETVDLDFLAINNRNVK